MTTDLWQCRGGLDIDELVKRMFDAAAGTDRMSVKAVSLGQRYTSLFELELERRIRYFIMLRAIRTHAVDCKFIFG